MMLLNKVKVQPSLISRWFIAYVFLQTIPGCSVTLGQDLEDNGKWPYAGATAAVTAMGAKHVNKDVDVSSQVDRWSGLLCLNLICDSVALYFDWNRDSWG